MPEHEPKKHTHIRGESKSYVKLLHEVQEHVFETRVKLSKAITEVEIAEKKMAQFIQFEEEGYGENKNHPGYTEIDIALGDWRESIKSVISEWVDVDFFAFVLPNNPVSQ
jgi:hypothetical protein